MQDQTCLILNLAFRDFQQHGQRAENKELRYMNMWTFAQKHPLSPEEAAQFIKSILAKIDAFWFVHRLAYVQLIDTRLSSESSKCEGRSIKRSN